MRTILRIELKQQNLYKKVFNTHKLKIPPFKSLKKRVNCIDFIVPSKFSIIIEKISYFLNCCQRVKGINHINVTSSCACHSSSCSVCYNYFNTSKLTIKVPKEE